MRQVVFISALTLFGFTHLIESQQPIGIAKPDYKEVKISEYDQLKRQEQEWKNKYETLLAENLEDSIEKPEPKVINRYHLTISEGMSSNDISQQLEEAGIILDAKEFNDYLADKKLQRYIQIGQYELDEEMNHQQIAEIITESL